MQTRMENKGKVRIFISQQYTIGLYVAIYEALDRPPLDQLNLNTTEETFHKDLRAGKVLKRGWKYKEVI